MASHKPLIDLGSGELGCSLLCSYRYSSTVFATQSVLLLGWKVWCEFALSHLILIISQVKSCLLLHIQVQNWSWWMQYRYSLNYTLKVGWAENAQADLLNIQLIRAKNNQGSVGPPLQLTEIKTIDFIFMMMVKAIRSVHTFLLRSMILHVIYTCRSLAHQKQRRHFELFGPLWPLSTLIHGCTGASSDTPFTNDKANELERSTGVKREPALINTGIKDICPSPPLALPFPFFSYSRVPSLSFWAPKSNTRLPRTHFGFVPCSRPLHIKIDE